MNLQCGTESRPVTQPLFSILFDTITVHTERLNILVQSGSGLHDQMDTLRPRNGTP